MCDAKEKIERLVSDCFKEIADHSLQSEVRSVHIKTINDNLKNISRLLEELPDRPGNNKSRFRERTIATGDKRNAVIKVAYAMSRFDFHILNDILNTRFNQTEAFEYLGRRLNVKATTLRNYRDRFDPYVKQENSGRKGWWQVELSDELQAIKDEYDNMDCSEIKDEIACILSDQPPSD
ncbi:MAG: hypothetical protein WC383_17175 [Gammaproteobacteria bacterium]